MILHRKSIYKILGAFALAFLLVFSSVSSVSARSFSGGGHSYGGTTRSYGGSTRSYGGSTRSFNTYRTPSTTTRKTTPSTTYKAPTAKSSSSAKTYSSPKTYHVNRNNSSSNNYYQPRRQSIGSEFGHSIVRGAGWSIGSHMGDSIWHQTFGFGGNQYYDNNGHVQYAKPGYTGWFGLLFMIVFIGLVIWLLRRFVLNRNRHIY